MRKHVKKITRYPNRLPALVFTAIFASIGVYILAVSRAAVPPGTITLTPSGTSMSVGANLNVTISVDSGTNNINTVEADLAYDKTKLQYLGFDHSTSGFSSEVEVTNPANADGVIDTVVADTTPKTGSQTVSIVKFKAIAPGNAYVNVANNSLVLTNTKPVQNLFVGGTQATYTINDVTAPNAPTGLAVSGLTVTGGNLTWTAPLDDVGVTGYDIYEGTNLLGSSATNSFTLKNLNPNTSYSITVKAKDSSNNISPASTPLVIKTLVDSAAPSVPAGLTASGVTGTTVNLNWNAATDNVKVASYNVYVGSSSTPAGSPSGTSYTVTGLTPGTTYAFRVQAKDTSGNLSAQSSAVSATTMGDISAPTKPAGLKVNSSTNTSVTLGWAASTDDFGVIGYYVYDNGTQVGSSAGTSLTINNLKAGTTHSYTVKARDAANNLSLASTALPITLTIKDGDVNGDDFVDLTDFSILAGNFRAEQATRGMGDLDNNHVVDPYDLSILCADWPVPQR